MVEVNVKFGSFGYVRRFATFWLRGGGVAMVIAVTLSPSCWCVGIGKREATRTCLCTCFWKKWYCWGVGEINLKGGFDVCNATINPIVDGRSKVNG